MLALSQGGPAHRFGLGGSLPPRPPLAETSKTCPPKPPLPQTPLGPPRFDPHPLFPSAEDVLAGAEPPSEREKRGMPAARGKPRRSTPLAPPPPAALLVRKASNLGRRGRKTAVTQSPLKQQPACLAPFAVPQITLFCALYKTLSSPPIAYSSSSFCALPSVASYAYVPFPAARPSFVPSRSDTRPLPSPLLLHTPIPGTADSKKPLSPDRLSFPYRAGGHPPHLWGRWLKPQPALTRSVFFQSTKQNEKTKTSNKNNAPVPNRPAFSCPLGD